jgi:hypothetical protein
MTQNISIAGSTFDVTLLLKGVLAGHGDAGERQNV